ncbi:STAS domain-containing protein [Streptomyces sp. SID2999]|uniref:STAS domain-containing protein n=1 Tax=Streptomyces sp. SID2999 TaxID=2690258 RepID=UPI00136E63FB|nr:STAS domain-containing protein [Streptomyces sp. SID2999]MYZ07266.1 STAS domain-containing protein [Streptomyces sp. SID2999]
MAAEPPFEPPVGPVLTVSAADVRLPELILAGDIGAEALRDLEEVLGAPPLHTATAWTVDMSQVTRIDLACAYALLRGATLRPEPAELTIRGPRRAVQRILRNAGLDVVAVIEE